MMYLQDSNDVPSDTLKLPGQPQTVADTPM